MNGYVPGKIVAFTREQGFGTVELDGGARMTFDVTKSWAGARAGVNVRVEVGEGKDGRARVTAVLPALTLENPYSAHDAGEVAVLLDQAARALETSGPTDVLRAQLDDFDRVLGGWAQTPHTKDARARIAALLRRWPAYYVDRGTAFGAGVIADAPTMDALFVYASSAGGARPSSKWLKEARGLVDAFGPTEFAARASRLFGLVERPKAPPMSERDSDLLKGLVWIASVVDAPSLASAIGDLAALCFTKIPDHGAVSNKVGNACLFTLGAMPGTYGVAQLGRLKARVKYQQALKLVEKAIASAADRSGLTSAEIEEASVPSFGLDASGRAEERVGDFIARIVVDGSSDVLLEWLDASGKPRASVPAEVKRDHADALKAVKARVKDIGALLPAQRARVETMMSVPRSIAFKDLRERYFEHGLVAPVARRLVWTFDGVAGIHDGERVVGVDGRPLDVREGGETRIWHPLGRSVEEVLAWRGALASRSITQPFKQAHREIYVVTDAELQTDTYSNRFAAHVLKQHQFAALCRDRGWRYTLQGQWDSHNTPYKDLEHANLRVEFWVEAAWNTTDTSGAGIFLYITTDQVRFTRDGAAVRMRDVPPLVFSEVMRDVDLFVGVASVGNDPTWRDHGHEQGRAYWTAYAFGDLNESAKTRRAALEALIPKLKIRDRCELSGRFLLVRGSMRAYKIHIGSGNILMEPNDQYLCIVQDRGGGAAQALAPGLVLPFEGDSMLSLILSKALLLADDAKIKDESILRQIRV